MKRKRRTGAKIEASTLRPGIRAILRRTAAAHAAIDQGIAGIVVEGNPPELGERREITADEARERYAARERATT